jgi:ATP-binding cassette subfamily B (MDR/TAP) protein 1
MFALSGEAVTKRLRSKAFRAVLRQEIAYFDQAEHSTGALCTRLATEASAVQGASVVCFGSICQYLFAMGIGTIFGFVYSWQLTLLMIAFLPLILFGGVFQIQLAARFARKDKKILEDAGKVCQYFVRSFI